jgi:hypothetical protein
LYVSSCGRGGKDVVSQRDGGIGIPNLKYLNVALRARRAWIQPVDPLNPYEAKHPSSSIVDVDL